MPKSIAPLVAAGARFVADDGPALAGHLAFVGLLSLIPFLLVVVALASLFGATETGTYFVAFIQQSLPDAVAETFEPALVEIFQQEQGGLLTVSLFGVIWVAGSGLEGIRAALNRAYGMQEQRPYWSRRLQGLMLVLVFSGLFLVAAICLFFGPILWAVIREWFGLGDYAERLWALIRYGVGGLTLFAVACTLYFALPARHPSWRGVLPGAAAALALFLPVSLLFSLYMSHFATYAVVYGSLGGVIATLMFFYLLGAIFIYGAELNAAVERGSGGD